MSMRVLDHGNIRRLAKSARTEDQLRFERGFPPLPDKERLVDDKLFLLHEFHKIVLFRQREWWNWATCGKMHICGRCNFFLDDGFHLLKLLLDVHLLFLHATCC